MKSAFARISELKEVLKLGPALNVESRMKILNEIDYIFDILDFGD